ncbi:hypothetical protein LSAT2_012720 [Lamellibrachia satsuma]|nr:hypothetical protein LSAT2_012720 [Lamellibrachia satsuma]
MESVNTSNVTNGTSCLQNFLNVTFDSGKSTYTGDVIIVVFLLCLLGLPGNLLVIAVYVRKMTTSTRVYMFALAVADSAVCVCGIVLSATQDGLVKKEAILYVINLSILFSSFLLVFVSIERFMAIRRPHSFNVNAQRAKKALIIIAVIATVGTSVNTVAKLYRYDQFKRVYTVCVALVCISAMATFYILMAVALLLRARTSRNQIAVLRGTSIHDSGPSQPGSSRRFTESQQPNAGYSNMTTKMKHVRSVENAVCVVDLGSSNVTMDVKVIKAVEEVAHPVGLGPSNVFTKVEETSVSASSRTTIPGAGTSASLTNTNKTVAKQTKTSANVALLFIITIVFVFCWLPGSLIKLAIPIPVGLQRLIVVNSVVNPFIYCVASAIFRKDVRQFLRQMRGKLFDCCQ